MPPPGSQQALQEALERIPAHAAALDESGTIIVVNEAWRRFGRENGLRSETSGVGTSYLRACETLHARSTEGPSVAGAIRRILRGTGEVFRRTYSCHGPRRAAWFQVEVAALPHAGMSGALVTHVPVPETVVRREIMDAERRHIARELRATTAENLASAIVGLERVAKAQRDNQGKSSKDLDEAIALCLRSLGEIRCLAYELAPPGLQPGRLVESLKRLATTFARRTGFAVMLLAAPLTIDDDLSRESSEALYRAAEESLYDARRHSGATSVSLHVRRTEDELRLEVRDDGHRIAPDAPQGEGLGDVRERLEACGGRMRVTALPGGTVVAATVPAGREAYPPDRTRR